MQPGGHKFSPITEAAVMYPVKVSLSEMQINGGIIVAKHLSTVTKEVLTLLLI